MVKPVRQMQTAVLLAPVAYVSNVVNMQKYAFKGRIAMQSRRYKSKYSVVEMHCATAVCLKV